MTTQAYEIIHFNGKERSLSSLPLENYWNAHPPRPYFVEDESNLSRGYQGTWAISEDHLYLVGLTPSEARKTSAGWLGDNAWQHLFLTILTKLGSDPTIGDILKLLNTPAQESTAAYLRTARAVASLAQNLLDHGGLSGADPLLELGSAVRKSQSQFVLEDVIPVTFESLFPNHHGKMLAYWYTGTLCLPEGEVLDTSGDLEGYRCDLRLEIRSGKLVGQQLHKYEKLRLPGL